MKIEHIKPADEPVPEIVSIITFDPWPFQDDAVKLANNVLFIDGTGNLRESTNNSLYREGEWNGWNRLATLSDGNTAALNAFYEVGTPLYLQ